MSLNETHEEHNDIIRHLLNGNDLQIVKDSIFRILPSNAIRKIDDPQCMARLLLMSQVQL